MKIKSVSTSQFRKFTNIQIRDIPEQAKLVVLVGPNGSGKSAIFDAINTWYLQRIARGSSDDPLYFTKGMSRAEAAQRSNRSTPPVDVRFHHLRAEEELWNVPLGLIHVRSAYRNDADFTVHGLQSVGNIDDQHRLQRMIDQDMKVSGNYHRLVSKGVEALYAEEPPETTLKDFQRQSLGTLDASLRRVFFDLALQHIGNPLVDGSFYFKKGATREFHYKNLSGGEKSVFDILLDLHIRTGINRDTIYLIDEPENHLNAAVQRSVLEEIIRIVPDEGQVWVTSHSFGVLNAAKRMWERSHDSVAFISFFDEDFDQDSIVYPTIPSKSLWNRVTKDVLDDVADLIAPAQVFFCEGKSVLKSSDDGADARCYNTIFASEFPDARFVSVGSSSELETIGSGLRNLVLKVSPSTKVFRVFDRDERSADEVCALTQNNGRVLKRRELESYLWDPEVLGKFCSEVGSPELAAQLVDSCEEVLATLRLGSAVPDEIKDGCGRMYVQIQKLFPNERLGSNHTVFMCERLAPLVTYETRVYQELKECLFPVVK